MTNLIRNIKILKVLLLLLGLGVSSGLLSQTNSFDILNGVISENGNLAAGITINIKGTLNQAISQKDGDFQIKRESNENLELIVNPCCTDFCPSTIIVEKNVTFVEIDCICKKGSRLKNSKIIVVKHYEDNGKIKRRKDKYIICK